MFSGSGASLTSLNSSNISTGTLSVARGGSGLNNLPLLKILIGNGPDPIYSTSLLRWDDTTDTLNSKFAGSGLGLTSLDANSISTGTLLVDYGGTGVNFLPGGCLLIGNGTGPITQSGNLSWDGTNNIFTDLNIAGNGSRLTNFNASNVSDGTLTVARGGTGATTFTVGRLLIGNGASAVTEDPELTWNGTTNVLTVTGTATITTVNATTGNITTVSATNIGIGITNPTTSSIEIVRPVTTATDIINMRYDTTNGLRISQSYITVNDVKQIFCQKNNNVDSSVLTIYKGNIGIGTTAPLVTTNTTRLHIYNAVKSSILLDTTTTGTSTLEFRRGTEFDIQQDYRFINDTDSILKLQYANNQEPYTDALAQLVWVLPNVTSGLLSVKQWKETEFVGNIGIGVAPSATYKVDVNGTLNVTNLISTYESTFSGVKTTGSSSTDGVIVNSFGRSVVIQNNATDGIKIFFSATGGNYFSSQTAFSVSNTGTTVGNIFLEWINQGSGFLIFTNHTTTIGSASYNEWYFRNLTSKNSANTTTWNIVSDQRVKENIKKANLKTCFQNVKEMNLYRYKYIDGFGNGSEHDKHQLGFVAQQVEKKI